MNIILIVFHPIPDHLDRLLKIGGAGPGKINTLLNLTKHQRDIYQIILTLKIYLRQNVNCLLINMKVYI